MVAPTIDVRRFKIALNKNYILLLTSNSVEKAALNSIMHKPCNATAGVSARGCRIGFIDDYFALHISGESGGSKPVSIGRIAARILADSEVPTPSLIALAGFCWGNPARTEVGDVILATRVHCLNHQVHTSTTSKRQDVLCCSTLDGTSIDLAAVEAHSCSELTRLLCGPLGSLEAYFGAAAARDDLLQEHPQILGGEMEGYHFLPDCSTIPWIVAKAVADPGDETASRDGQQDAAKRAAMALRATVKRLANSEQLQEPLETPAATTLGDIILGSTIAVHSKDVEPQRLNDYLNDVVGTRVSLKLKNYGYELEFGPSFSSITCAFILEVMQNALRHGKARVTEVRFSNSRVVLQDDGSIFDVQNLSGQRGGSQALQKLTEAFIEIGEVALKTQKAKHPYRNKYVLELTKVNQVLQIAMRDCRAQVVEQTIGSPLAVDILDFPDDCPAIYLNVGRVRMFSRALDISGAIRDVVAKGKQVFLACHSQEDVMFYRETLSDLPSNLVRVFVGTEAA